MKSKYKGIVIKTNLNIFKLKKYISKVVLQGNVVLNLFFAAFSGRFPTEHGNFSPYGMS